MNKISKTKPTKVVKLVPNTEEAYQEKLKRVEFGIDKHTMVSLTSGLRLEFYFVALKDKQTGVTLELTPYTKLLRYCNARLDERREETIRQKGSFLCMFLNYVLIENYHRFKIDEIKDVDIEHGEKFLKAYADGLKGGKVKSKQTVFDMEQKLAQIYSDIKDVYKEEAKHIYKLKLKERTKYGMHYIAHFNLRIDNENKETKIFRDLPSKVFWRLLKLSKIYYPELTFAIALQAFAGLRAGEVCNVRQEVSKFGRGVEYATVDRQFIYFQINLMNKYPMRSDLKDVGNIKVRRKQKVYEKYLPNLKELYEEHLKILAKYDFKDGYHPMFVNHKGQALTVSDYRDKMHRLINKHLKKDLANSGDDFLIYYSTILMQYRLSPHAFRHWFTVTLVLDGKSPNEISSLRGDSSTSTALWYCSRKTEIEQAIKHSNTKMMNQILSQVKEI